LNPEDQDKLEDMKHLITDIERIGDHANNLAEFAQRLDSKKIKISKDAQKELKVIFKKVIQNYKITLKALKSRDKEMVDEIANIEEEVDGLEKDYKRNHIERLKKNICHPEADTIYIESLRNLERISDHAYNIALTLIY
jgi:phosphate:Na+ symporter